MAVSKQAKIVSLVPRAVVPRLVVAALDYRTASRTLLDSLFADDAAVAAGFARLGAAGIAEAVIVSTCDRAEIWAVDDVAEDVGARLGAVLTGTDGAARAAVVRRGEDALHHVFAVAASLESRVVGEPEVLGQVKAAWRRADDAGMAGPGLARVMDAAFAVAKRVRSETGIGERAVSIAAAAGQVAREVLGDFESARALVVGGAEIGVLVTERMKAHGLRHVTVADPLAPRADALAARLGAHLMPMAEVAPRLHAFDAVLCGLGGTRPTIAAGAVAAALKARRYRPMFLLDAAVPPDIDLAVRALDEAYLFDLDDLERIALSGQAQRAHEAEAARRILVEAAARFVEAEGGRAAAPAIAELRGRFEEVRRELLAEHPGLGAEEATRLLVNRLLHAPSLALRALAAEARHDGPAKAGPANDGPGLFARLFGPKQE